MKRVFILSIAILIILLSCNRTEKCNLHNISVNSDIPETLTYIGKIGNDFDSALDSLMILKELEHSSITVQKIPVPVVFDCDNRQFWGIIFDYCGNYSDVLDSKGNYYNRTWTTQ